MNGQPTYNAMPQNRGYNALADDRNMQLMRIRDQIERERRYGSMSQGTRPMNLAENAAYAGKELTGINAMNRGYQTVRDFRGEHGIMNPATMGDYAKANVGLAGNALEATMAGMDMGALAGPSGRMASNAIEQAIKANPGLFPDTQAGMVAWHGSPHKFPAVKDNPLGEFDLSKMGSGEGAQAYGWGTYLAEGKGTAKFYQEAGVDVTPRLRMAIDDNNGNVSDTIKALTKEDPHNLLPEAQAIEGHLYEVDLPDTEIDKMLDWDKPLSEQSEHVKTKLGGVIDELKPEKVDVVFERGPIPKAERHGGHTNPDQHAITIETEYGMAFGKGGSKEAAYKDAIDSMTGDLTGMQLYNKLAMKLEGSTGQLMGRGSPQASEYLLDKGIVGNKFLDQVSRGAGEGTRNFVVFDPKKAKITGRN